MFKINNIYTEYALCPLGLDEKTPRFSWELAADGQNVMQSSYHITVRAGEKTVWDSGEVQGDESYLVEYAGEALLPRTRYEVALTVKNSRGEAAEAETYFETGLMAAPSGEFITHREETLPCFFKQFALKGKISRARIYATALGVYELTLNGKRVGDAYDAPGWTSYTHTLQYQTYDVTALLSEENELSALVGRGWYTGFLGYFHREHCYGEREALCLDLYLDYEDGTSEVISTGKDWSVTSSQLLTSEFLRGDTFDETRPLGDVHPVEVLPFDKSVIVAQLDEPNRVTEVFPAKELIVTPKGEYVLDFGQNMTGIVEFDYQGERGQEVSVDHAEVLDPEGNFYTANLRWATAVDSYVLDGTLKTRRPKFTSHGFRYIKLTGFGEIDLKCFRALALHTDLKKTGKFTCENALVDKLQKNIEWGQRGNFFELPTDCPQRDERLGWTADAQVFTRTALFHYNCQRFYRKWLQDLRNEQTMENGVPVTVPNVIPGNEKGAAVWGDAATIMPWTLYTVYGDKRVLSEQYPSMKGWVDYITSRSKNHLWQQDFQFGDWLALDRGEVKDNIGATDVYFIASAYYAYSAKLVYKAAEILGLKEDAAAYKQLHEDIITAFRKEYVTETGRLVSETQTSYTLTLALGLVPEAFRARELEGLVALLKKNNDHLNTGFVGTPHLLLTLSENGRHDLACKLFMNEDFPSWLYAVKKGATTVWERWNAIREDGSFYPPDMSSFNHYAYGCVGDWLYRKVVGIDTVGAGYKHLLIRPRPLRELGNFACSYLTPYGEVAVSLAYEGGMARFTVKVPVNTTAKIDLPNGEVQEVGSGEYTFEMPEEIASIRVVDPLEKVRVGELLADEAYSEKLKAVIPAQVYAQAWAYGQERPLKSIAEKFPASEPVLLEFCAKKGVK